MNYHGDFLKGDTIRLFFNTTNKSGGRLAPSTAGTARAYANSSGTAITAGITFTQNFGGKVGLHLLEIDTSDAAYAAGNDYLVVMDGIVVDGETNTAGIGQFSLENRTDGLYVPAGVTTSPANQAEFRSTDLDADDDTYNGQVVVFISGANRGISRPITDYAGGTRQVTVDPPFPNVIANGDRFRIIGWSD